MQQVPLRRPRPGAKTVKNAPGHPSQTRTWSKNSPNRSRSPFADQDLKQKRSKMHQVTLRRPGPGAKTAKNAAGHPSQAATWSKNGPKRTRSPFAGRDLEQKRPKTHQVTLRRPRHGAKRRNLVGTVKRPRPFTRAGNAAKICPHGQKTHARAEKRAFSCPQNLYAHFRRNK